jgi:hypothetical protein
MGINPIGGNMNIVIGMLVIGIVGTIGMGAGLVLNHKRMVENWGTVAIFGTTLAGLAYTVLM